MKLENHIDVYVDVNGRIRMAQHSMEESCGISLELEEARNLISLLTEAVNEVVGMSTPGGGVTAEEKEPVALFT